MEKMLVKGGIQLNGEVHASGAKNSALPLLFSTLLAPGKHVFKNVPHLMDIQSTMVLLKHLGCEISWEGSTVQVDVPELKSFEAPYDLVRKMRASILCLGPLMARYGQAKVSLPGGCAIGTRPIDLHLEGLKEMGAQIDVDSGYVFGKVDKLKGAKLIFESPTVTGTENLMMAACLADGVTLIENAAKEPEIWDLAEYLNKMGAKISGHGSSIIRIEGVDRLTPAEHVVIPDRIEAGTLLLAGAITGGEVTVSSCRPDDLDALISKMKESGFKLSIDESSITVHKNTGYTGVDVTTAPHPAFPTDLQAQFMALMTQADGTSVITETIFENRFMHVQELVRLNADITPKTRVAIVRGAPGSLKAAPVMATDLRASACLILAGLAAQGETEVNRIYHLDRGYEKMEEKLSKLGAQICRKN
ncbi:MAG TPA: UDP-N-acetylglucosamine 1-carboxyvinyltransferase [Bdellovibrionales bacterium]|nr:UDP-N-acetylglucosamine 1-carboxyvinyltransferase [Pseudobdellovibrionaceae bacterium]HAG91485.1 UDP-N-acetylglucosamine 1-carboxyvinyltransferase [Bdellovibrionales bacterium]|tara:strand:+ start:1919 stop:3172 length:1254 start_codon:yes stop_codon:yes gene_type:complete